MGLRPSLGVQREDLLGGVAEGGPGGVIGGVGVGDDGVEPVVASVEGDRARVDRRDVLAVVAAGARRPRVIPRPGQEEAADQGGSTQGAGAEQEAPAGQPGLREDLEVASVLAAVGDSTVLQPADGRVRVVASCQHVLRGGEGQGGELRGMRRPPWPGRRPWSVPSRRWPSRLAMAATRWLGGKA